MIKIKFIKDTELKKIGDIVNCSKKAGDSAVKNGYAEYIEEAKTLIPKQLQNPDFRFILLRKNDKRPIEKEWEGKNNYQFNDPKLLSHIERGNNYGIIGGYANLVIIDADSQEINDQCKLCPETFTIKTGSPEEYKNHYLYFGDKEIKPIRLSKEKVGDIGDVRSTGQYIVAPNSIHPSGNPYKVIKDLPIANISEDFVKTIFKDHINLISPPNSSKKEKKDYKIDTTKRLSQFTKNCRVPDYTLNNELPKGISKNWKLFPYVIDILNARGVSENLYEALAEKQNHDIGAVAGWVKNAKEGKLAKTSCKKMREYLGHYTPKLVNEICGKCKLYKEIKEEEETKSEVVLKERLFREHKERISKNEEVNEILNDPNFLEIINNEFEKKIVGEHEARKTIFMVANMRNVSNLGKATDNLMINAPSGVGKDHTSEAVYDLIPREEKEELIRTTPKVLAYTRNKNLDEKATWKKVTLRMEDVPNQVLNDDCFKVMSSANSNKINYAKVVNNGKVIESEIEGKPSIIITIASANPKEELLRRYPICNLDEGINQTKEILKRQAKFAVEGKSVDYNEDIINALRLLKRINVKVPYAEQLTKIFCAENVIVRTHFPRFLDYIKSSCALHQFQRKKDNEGFYLAEKQDYDISRIMLIKTTSNILMIPLTQLQQKIMKFFEENDIQNKSVNDLEDYDTIKKLDIDIEYLRRKLNWLVSKSFLTRISEKRYRADGKLIPKPVYIYSYNKLQKLIIPKWEEISSFSLNRKNTSNSSLSSVTIKKDKKKEVIEQNEVNNQENHEETINNLLEDLKND